MGRFWDNGEGSRLRSKYLAKVVRSVSTDGFLSLHTYVCFVCTCFFLSLVCWKNGRTSCWFSLSQIVINGTEVEAYRIEKFAERSAECRGYYVVHGIPREGFNSNYFEWPSCDETDA